MASFPSGNSPGGKYSVCLSRQPLRRAQRVAIVTFIDFISFNQERRTRKFALSSMENIIVITVLIMLSARLAWASVLSLLNISHVQRCGQSPPGRIPQVMDMETYRKSINYTLAREKFGLFGGCYETIILLLVLFSGFLPWMYEMLGAGGDSSLFREGMYIILAMYIISLPDLPLEYYSQFRLEERFGFNRSTVRLWVADRIKGLVIGAVIGAPLTILIIFLIDKLGYFWWLWAFAVLFAFQLIMMVLYPMLILPWFNTLTPLPEGELKQRLMALANRAGFKARTIQVMDGSKRSGHSNAFFTGFGRFRRIVLFDTLIEQMNHDELEAVLAHEIGHYKQGHVPRMLALSAIIFLAGLWVLAGLLNLPAFVDAWGFDFDESGPGPALLLFGLLSGHLVFWLSPLMGTLSRKHEYESDRFAARHVGPGPMISALRRLSKKNLSNLTPHPLYSGFYYSHPTLFERENSLMQYAQDSEQKLQ